MITEVNGHGSKLVLSLDDLGDDALPVVGVRR
jgi:hypothetical protein